jgi:hypothetical protein
MPEGDGDLKNPVDEAKEAAIRRDERERVIKILLRNQFCFMGEVVCPGHSSENCEACAREVLGRNQ